MQACEHFNSSHLAFGKMANKCISQNVKLLHVALHDQMEQKQSLGPDEWMKIIWDVEMMHPRCTRSTGQRVIPTVQTDALVTSVQQTFQKNVSTLPH